MYKVAEVINDFGTAFYLALIASFGYFVKWLIKKISNLVGKEFKNNVEEIVNEKNKPILDLAKENSSELKLLKTKQDDIFTKLRETKHEIKANTESSINHQVLDSLERLQDFINKSNKNDK